MSFLKKLFNSEDTTKHNNEQITSCSDNNLNVENDQEDDTYYLLDITRNVLNDDRRFTINEIKETEYGYIITVGSVQNVYGESFSCIFIDRNTNSMCITTHGTEIPKNRIVEFTVASTKIDGVLESTGDFTYLSCYYDFSTQPQSDYKTILTAIEKHYGSFGYYHNNFLECIQSQSDFSSIGG